MQFSFSPEILFQRVLLEGPWEKTHKRDIPMVQRDPSNINPLSNGYVMKQHRVQNPAEQLLELKALLWVSMEVIITSQ